MSVPDEVKARLDAFDQALDALSAAHGMAIIATDWGGIAYRDESTGVDYRRDVHGAWEIDPP
jgi:hypothetical protein